MPDLTALALASRISTTVATSAWATVRTQVLGALRYAAISSDGTRYYQSHGTADLSNGTNQLLIVAADGTVTSGTAGFNGRYAARAAWLNGKHYVHGGVNGASGTSVFGLFEAYTPAGTDGASGTWAQLTTGPVLVGHELVALGGFLYTVGGTSNNASSGVVATLSRYDPTANTWATLTSMPAARQLGVAFVAGGKIYYAGGVDTSGISQLTTYVYDPAAGTWATLGTLPGYPAGPGGVVAVGTRAYLTFNTTTTYVLDLTTGTWSTSTSLGTSLTAHDRGQTFAAGSVVTAFSGTATQQSMERLDLTAAVDNTPPGWATLGALAANRYDSAVSTDGTTVYLSHGLITGNTVVGTLSVVNASTGATATGTADGTPLLGPAGAFVNGKHLVIGGATSTTNGSAAVTSVRAYTPAGTAGAAGTWAAAAALPVATVYAAAVTVGGSVYVAGGSASYGSLVGRTTFQRYDAAGDTWTNLTATAPLPAGRMLGLMVAVGTKLYYLGGYDASSTTVATVFVYDTVAGTWTTAPALPTAPAVGGAAAAGGLVYYTGAASKALSTYNPTTGVTTATATPVPTGHGAEAGNLVPLVTIGTRLVVAGGVGTTNVDTLDTAGLSPFARRLRNLQQYLVAVGLPVAATAARRIPTTPPVSAWSVLGQTPGGAARNQGAVSSDGTNIYLTHGQLAGTGVVNTGFSVSAGGTITTLPPDNVTGARDCVASAWAVGRHWVIGGNNGGAVTTVSSYGPTGTAGAAGTWNAAISLPVARAYPGAVGVGTFIYVFGGGTSTSPGTAQSTFYRYDLSTGTWATLSSAGIPARMDPCLVHSAGKIYMFGGFDTAGSGTKTIFVYDIAAGTWTTSATALAYGTSWTGVLLGTTAYLYDRSGGSLLLVVQLPSLAVTVGPATILGHGAYPPMGYIGTQLIVVGGATGTTIESLDVGAGPAYTAAVRNTRSLAAAGV